jgi:hypothetical protein
VELAPSALEPRFKLGLLQDAGGRREEAVHHARVAQALLRPDGEPMEAAVRHVNFTGLAQNLAQL